LYVLLTVFVLRGGCRFGSRSIGCPVEFELLVGVGHVAVVIGDVEVAGCAVAEELQEAIFQGEACCFVFDQFYAGELFGVPQGFEEGLEEGFVHPRV